MSATYDASTYSSETYDTGLQQVSHGRGAGPILLAMPRYAPTIVKDTLYHESKIAVIVPGKIRHTSKLCVIVKNVIKHIAKIDVTSLGTLVDLFEVSYMFEFAEKAEKLWSEINTEKLPYKLKIAFESIKKGDKK